MPPNHFYDNGGAWNDASRCSTERQGALSQCPPEHLLHLQYGLGIEPMMPPPAPPTRPNAAPPPPPPPRRSPRTGKAGHGGSPPFGALLPSSPHVAGPGLQCREAGDSGLNGFGPRRPSFPLLDGVNMVPRSLPQQQQQELDLAGYLNSQLLMMPNSQAAQVAVARQLKTLVAQQLPQPVSSIQTLLASQQQQLSQQQYSPAVQVSQMTSHLIQQKTQRAQTGSFLDTEDVDMDTLLRVIRYQQQLLSATENRQNQARSGMPPPPPPPVRSSPLIAHLPHPPPPPPPPPYPSSHRFKGPAPQGYSCPTQPLKGLTAPAPELLSLSHSFQDAVASARGLMSPTGALAPALDAPRCSAPIASSSFLKGTVFEGNTGLLREQEQCGARRCSSDSFADLNAEMQAGQGNLHRHQHTLGTLSPGKPAHMSGQPAQPPPPPPRSVGQTASSTPPPPPPPKPSPLLLLAPMWERTAAATPSSSRWSAPNCLDNAADDWESSLPSARGKGSGDIGFASHQKLASPRPPVVLVEYCAHPAANSQTPSSPGCHASSFETLFSPLAKAFKVDADSCAALSEDNEMRSVSGGSVVEDLPVQWLAAADWEIPSPPVTPMGESNTVERAWSEELGAAGNMGPPAVFSKILGRII